MTIETGNLEQAYYKEESAFDVSPADALASTDGIRHLELNLGAKLNREPSPQKQGTPDENQSLPRRKTSTWDLSQIMWEPSGTLGTISNVGGLIEGGMGAKTAVNLDTTVASGGTTTGAVLTSAGTLAVGDCVVVSLASPTRREVTRIKSVAGATVTWDALSAAPANGAVVVSGVNYKFTNNITKSYAIYKYYNAGGFKQATYGSVVDMIKISFDGTKEVMLGINGPAAEIADSTFGTVQAKPGSHTTVGSPAGGMIGNVYIDGNAFLVIAANIEMNNKIVLRNKELGTSKASGIAGRENHREVKCRLTFFLEDVSLLTKAHNVTHAVLRVLVGQTNGNMVGAVMPNLEFELPDFPNATGPMELTVEARGYAVSGNDALFLTEA